MFGRSWDKKQGRAEPRSPLFFPVAIVVAIWVIFGGNAPTSVVLFAMLGLSGSILLALVVVWGGLDSWRTLVWPAQLLLFFCCLMPMLQLIPLPPVLWHALPGRALPVETLTAAGMATAWHPITLAVEPTFRTALVFVWLAALLLALLQLSSDEFRRIFGLLLMLGILNVAVGVVQVVSGNTIFQFYHGLNSPFLNGLFANKNHTGLFIAITFLTGYATFYAKSGWYQRGLGLVIPAGLVLFIALLATFSRTGIAFGLMAIVFLVLLSLGNKAWRGVPYLLIGILVMGVGLLAVIASTDLASRSISRFSGVSTDLRWSIWEWSWPLVHSYFPVGSGIGSFTAVFPPHEQLAWVRPTFVNHAHNDYLEQLIEIGVVAPITWILLVVALYHPSATAWGMRDRQSGRLALIGAAILCLIAIHSAFDYPLRRPAIATTAMVALAAMLRLDRRKSRLRGAAGYARQAEQSAADLTSHPARMIM